MDKAKSPRQQAMEEVVASRTATLEKELALSATGAHPEVEFEPAPTEPVKEPLTQPGASVEPTDPITEPEVVVEPPKPEMVMVKVDDEEFEVPKADIDKSGSVAIYQMEKALSKRLKAANELQAQAKKQLQELAVKPAEPQPNQDEVARNKLATLRFGSDEEALTVFNELKQPTISVDAIAQTVSKRIEWDGAAKKFIKDNADILQDADVQTLAIARENELRQTMQQTNQWHPDFNKFYEDLGSKLRSKFGKPAVLDVKTRQEKKEAIVEPKTAAGRIPPAPETKQKSVAEMVDEQRKARHQPSMR